MIVYTNDDYYKDIANAIREKTGGEETYLPSEMGDGVRAIQSGGEAVIPQMIDLGIELYFKVALNNVEV